MKTLCLVVLTAVLGQFTVDAKRDVRGVREVRPAVPIMVTVQPGVDSELLGDDGGVTIVRTITETVKFDVAVRTLSIAIAPLPAGLQVCRVRFWAGFNVDRELDPNQPFFSPSNTEITLSISCSGPDRTCGLIACEFVNCGEVELGAIPATP